MRGQGSETAGFLGVSPWRAGGGNWGQVGASPSPCTGPQPCLLRHPDSRPSVLQDKGTLPPCQPPVPGIVWPGV